MTLPITIIGGYLGSGKTTLVNHLLRNADGLRIAVLVNEFGELPIDEDLIEAEEEGIISIAGGCVCCSYGSDLTFALMELTDLSPPPDHVLLEASGVALPGAIASSVSLRNGYQMDGVVVLADAETIYAQAGDAYIGDTITRQINDADLIVLNKADLSTGQKLSDTKAWLIELAPDVEVIPTIRGSLPPEILLQSFLGRERKSAGPHHHQADIFETMSFDIIGPVVPDLLARELASAGLKLVRAKGFVKTGDGQKMAIQTVGRRWEVFEAPAEVSTGLIAIGYKSDIDVDAIRGLIKKYSE